jgi:hypothetical protein
VAVPVTTRRVLICFDSDGKFKPSVRAAQRTLARQLVDRGANPYEVVLPSLPGRAKTGADDFLVHHRKHARKAWNALPKRSLFMPEGLTASELMARNLPAPTAIVEALIYAGLITFSGAPKLGKSRFTRQLALDVVSDGKVLGTYKALRGAEVMLFALEDPLALVKKHLHQLAARGVVVDTNRLHLRTTFEETEGTGLEALDRALQERPAIKLVVIDTLAKIRSRPTGKGQLYYEDYDAIASLKRIADDRGVAIIVVHHTRKAGDADIFNTISGSTGISGSADTNMVLVRGRGEVEAELHVTGRNVEEQALALAFDEHGVWRLIGPAADHRKSEARKAILAVLAELKRPAAPKEIAELIAKNREAVKRTMLNMATTGDLRPVGDGTYARPEWPIGK